MSTSASEWPSSPVSRDLHAAEDQRPAGFELMDIVAQAYAIHAGSVGRAGRGSIFPVAHFEMGRLAEAATFVQRPVRRPAKEGFQ